MLLGFSFFLMHTCALAEWDGRGYHSDGVGGLSFIVLFIGALHAMPVFIVAMLTKSKAITFLVALGSALFAVMIGGLPYMVIDLIFVGIGTYAAFKLHLDEKAEDVYPERPLDSVSATIRRATRVAHFSDKMYEKFVVDGLIVTTEDKKEAQRKRFREILDSYFLAEGKSGEASANEYRIISSLHDDICGEMKYVVLEKVLVDALGERIISERNCYLFMEYIRGCKDGWEVSRKRMQEVRLREEQEIRNRLAGL
jgi:hypothetical protein